MSGAQTLCCVKEQKGKLEKPKRTADISGSRPGPAGVARFIALKRPDLGTLRAVRSARPPRGGRLAPRQRRSRGPKTKEPTASWSRLLITAETSSGKSLALAPLGSERGATFFFYHVLAVVGFYSCFSRSVVVKRNGGGAGGSR